MPRRPASLRVRLLLLALLALLPALGLTLATALEDREAAIAEATDQLRLIASAEAEDQEDLLQGARQAVVIVAHLRAVQMGDWAACDRDLAELLPHLPGYVNLGVANLNGQIQCSAVYPTPRPAVAEGIGHREHFQRALATQDFAVGGYQVGRATNRASINVAVPVTAEDGAVRGVAFAALNATFLAAQVVDTPLPAGGVVALLDRHGTVVALGPDPSGWTGREAANTTLWQALLGRGASGSFEAEGLDGVDRLQAFGRAGDEGEKGAGAPAPLTVVVSLPRGSVLAPVEASFLRNLAVVAAVAALTLGAVLVLARQHVLAPLADLSVLAARLGEGDLRARLARPPKVPEFAALGRALEGMAARVHELDVVKSRFINTAAHELRTPMTPILLQLHALRTGLGPDSSPATRRSLDILERNVERLDRLIRDIVDGARAQASAMRLERREVDLDALVGEAVLAYGGVADAAGVALEFHPGRVPPLEGDRLRLGQVVDNLLANALKFTPRGGLVRVQTSARDGHAVLRVADTGTGLRPEDLPRLFLPFSQVEDPLQRTNAGAGLGLYIARTIVELHGGRIWAESPGRSRGAVFLVELPVRDPDARTGPARPAFAGPPEAPEDPRRRPGRQGPSKHPAESSDPGTAAHGTGTEAAERTRPDGRKSL